MEYWQVQVEIWLRAFAWVAGGILLMLGAFNLIEGLLSQAGFQGDGSSMSGIFFPLVVGGGLIFWVKFNPAPKWSRQLWEMRLPFLQKGERAEWWLYDDDKLRAVITACEWRTGRVKGLSPAWIFVESDQADTDAELVFQRVGNPQGWANLVREGTLVKLADGPRYHRPK